MLILDKVLDAVKKRVIERVSLGEVEW